MNLWTNSSSRWVVLLGLAFSVVSHSAPTVQTTLPANLVYQLDCVSFRIRSCGNRDAYVVLWQTRFGIDVAHDEDVAAWTALKAHYPPKEGENSNSTDPTLLRTVSFEAVDVDAYLAAIRLYLEPGDWENARRIVKRFQPAFEEWWDERAEEPLRRQVASLKTALDSGGVSQELVRLHAFFGVPETTENGLAVVLVRRVVQSSRSTAESIGRYALLEIADDGNAAQRMDVAVHEYSHLLFRQMPRARLQVLRDNIVSGTGAPSLARLGAWNLFNEALATAIGNGRVGRVVDPRNFATRMANKGGLYFDDAIDGAAKALLPVLDRTLDAGGTIDSPAFAEAYVAAVEAALPTQLRNPKVLLQELAMFEDSSLADRDDTFVPVILKALSGNHSLWSYRASCCGAEFLKFWAAHDQQPRLAIVTVSQRPAAAELCTDSASEETGFTVRVVGGRPCIVLAVTRASEVEAALLQILSLPELATGDYELIGTSIQRRSHF